MRLLSDKPEGRTSAAHLSLMDLCQVSGHIYTDLSPAGQKKCPIFSKYKDLAYGMRSIILSPGCHVACKEQGYLGSLPGWEDLQGQSPRRRCFER